MALASVTKIPAASSQGFDAAVREWFVAGPTHPARHYRPPRRRTQGDVETARRRYRVTMEVTFILETEAPQFFSGAQGRTRVELARLVYCRVTRRALFRFRR